MFSSSFAALVGFGLYFLFASALLPQVAARFATIQFSAVKQCGGFSVNFAGGTPPDALPLTLSVLPVNGTPVFIPLPADAWNSTSESGVMVTFLPFPAGTEFIASLDDANGDGAALVSDVLVIEESDTDNTACLPLNSLPFAPRYSPVEPLSQCESFTLAHDPAFAAPTVRAFVPKGASFAVDEINSTISVAGASKYLMDVPRDSIVVLMYKDQDGYAETSTMLPVLGDITSDESCIPTNPLTTAAILYSDDNNNRGRVNAK